MPAVKRKHTEAGGDYLGNDAAAERTESKFDGCAHLPAHWAWKRRQTGVRHTWHARALEWFRKASLRHRQSVVLQFLNAVLHANRCHAAGLITRCDAWCWIRGLDVHGCLQVRATNKYAKLSQRLATAVNSRTHLAFILIVLLDLNFDIPILFIIIFQI